MNIPPISNNVAATNSNASVDTRSTYKPTTLASATVDAPENTTQDAKPIREQVQESVKSLNEFISSLNNNLQFSVDEDTGKTIVKVTDKDTNQVIKQFPSEEILSIAKAIDKLKGLLIHQKV